MNDIVYVDPTELLVKKSNGKKQNLNTHPDTPEAHLAKAKEQYWQLLSEIVPANLTKYFRNSIKHNLEMAGKPYTALNDKTGNKPEEEVIKSIAAAENAIKTKEFYNQKIICRIRGEMPENTNPPYNEWIKKHAQDIMELKGPYDNNLFSGINVRKARDGDKEIYVIDYSTTKEGYRFYEDNYAEKMRGVFSASYPETSSFKVERVLINNNSSPVQKTLFDKLEKGLGNSTLSFDTVIATGSLLQKA